VVLLELERRGAVEGVAGAVEAERARVEALKAELGGLEEAIESSKGAMKRFRAEFEQLRVALLVDRMAKSSQVAALADRRCVVTQGAAGGGGARAVGTLDESSG
jgi:chromosome segregation ATPase